VEEVHRCADAGAVLVKILPNTQRFDPADPRFLPFYRALAQCRLPLLSHVGYEFGLPGRDQAMGDPVRLRLALDEGVTVIAAHACSYGLMVYERYLPALLDLAARYRQFYADISALTMPHRFGMLLRLRHHPELHDRLLFGTDYPLPVFHVAAWGRVGWSSLREMVRTKNRFDRQVAVCHGLGLRFRSLDAIVTVPEPADHG
jgi:predicted TIM-barrel fold metal-dependent hydrolase